MSVEELLGLGADCDLLAQARRRWSRWTARDERLAVVEDFDDLRPWLRRVGPVVGDPPLLALGMLAAPDGGDDLAAAAALVHLLMPGAVRMAQRANSLRGAWRTAGLSTVVPGAEDADAHIAAHLWLEVRSFPWRRLRNVAANIMLNVRAAVMAEYGAHAQVARRERVWAHTIVLDVVSYSDVLTIGPRPAAAMPWRGAAASTEELSDLLSWAAESGVISDQDRLLLLCLVEEVWDNEAFEATRTNRALNGFAGHEITARVGERVGLAGVTVRRRSTRAVRALAAAAAEYIELVA